MGDWKEVYTDPSRKPDCCNCSTRYFHIKEKLENGKIYQKTESCEEECLPYRRYNERGKECSHEGYESKEEIPEVLR